MQNNNYFFNPKHLSEFSKMITSIYNSDEILGIFKKYSYKCDSHDTFYGLIASIDNRKYIPSFLEHNNKKTVILEILEYTLRPKREENKEKINEILKEYDLYMNSFGAILESDNQECSIQTEESIHIKEIKLIDDAHIDQDIKMLVSDAESCYYFGCLFNSYIMMMEDIRKKTNLKTDGGTLIKEAFSEKNPYLLLHYDIDTNETSKNEHNGVVKKISGFCSSVRNVIAHKEKECDRAFTIRALHEVSSLRDYISKMHVIRRHQN